MRTRRAIYPILRYTILGIAMAKASPGLVANDPRYSVYKSTDRGRTWHPAGDGLPETSRINAIGASSGILLAGTDTGLFASRDGARTWQSTSGMPSKVSRITSLGTVQGTLFAGTADSGLLISVNGGQGWTVSPSFTSKFVRCMAASGKSLYVGTDRDGVFVTTDAGSHWGAMAAGLPANAQVFSLAITPERIFAGLYSNGLMGWDPPEQRWVKTGPVSPLALTKTAETLIAGHNPGGLYWSADLGDSWSKGLPERTHSLPEGLLGSGGELPIEAPVWELAAHDGLAIAGAADGVFYSEDGGRTWIRAIRGLPTDSPGIAFHVQSDLLLAALSLKTSNALIEVPKKEPSK